MKYISVLILLLLSASNLLASQIIYPWRATTAIVKAGETFEVWFQANSGQSINSVELRSPYLTVSTSRTVASGTWEYDHESGNTYNRRITVTVPSNAPTDRYDLIVNTSSGERISPAAVRVIQEYKDLYYVVQLADAHRWQNTNTYPMNVTARKVGAVIDVANIIGAEIIFECGDHLYNFQARPDLNAERVNIMFGGTMNWSGGNLHGVEVDTLGLNDARGAVFIVPGNHDSPSQNYQNDPSKAHTLNWYNQEYGLAYFNFKYGNARYMGFNSGMGAIPAQQRNAATSWLNSVGNGNLRVGIGHAGQNPVVGFDNAVDLNLLLVGHNHFQASNNPHTFNGKPIQYVANSMRDKGTGNFEFNLFRVNNNTGTFQVLGGSQSRVRVIENHTEANINNPSSWIPMLELNFSNANNGSSSTNTATFTNRHNFAIPDAHARFVMPKGHQYSVSNGTITQAFDGDSVHVVDVSVNLGANSTTVVEIQSSGSGGPGGPSGPAGSAVNINFQPASASVPAGYLADTSEPFGDRGNGYSYGWTTTFDETRERNSDPDQRLDTFNHTQLHASDRVWEIELPNGDYHVTITGGDPDWDNSFIEFVAEAGTANSVTLASGDAAGVNFVSGSAVVTVSDGRLTISNGPNAVNNKISYVNITPLNSVVNINFQPASAAVPLGYLADTSELFGDRGNGFSYGWTTSFDATRERNSDPDQRLDTLNHTQAQGVNRVWEIELPNGSYEVSITGGDPDFDNSFVEFVAEAGTSNEVTLVSGSSAGVNFVSGSAIVTVSDGRLTISNGPNAVSNKINYVDITPVNDVVKVNFQPASASVPSGYLADTSETFGDRGNGYSYGWTTSFDMTRERNSDPDKRLDTLNHTQAHGVNRVWEIELPNGSYSVSITGGDPDFDNSFIEFVAEAGTSNAVTLVSGNAAGVNFLSGSAIVTVSDGRLTISNGPNAVNNKINYVVIVPVIDVKINFQPASASVPSGYLADTSELFGDRGNGYSYGWTTSFDRTRERDSHSDKRLDTLNHTQWNGDRVWQIELPNGDYNVSITGGDPDWDNSFIEFVAQAGSANEVTLASGDPTGVNFISGSAVVTVSNGLLTISNGPNAVNNKINYIDIVTDFGGYGGSAFIADIGEIDTELDAYATWKTDHNITDDFGDDDNDGISNLLEFALGGDPKIPGTAKLPQISVDGGTLQFTLQRQEEAVTYVIQKSTDLTNWVDFETVTDAHGPVGSEVTVTVPAPEMGTSQLFLRLRVERK